MFLCGRGQCTMNRQGEYISSDIEGGYELCERQPAGR
jgi:hypothetical protein